MITMEKWEPASIGKLVDIINGFAFLSEEFTDGEGIPLIRIRDLEGQNTEVNYRGDYNDRYLVERDDLLIGMDGDFLTVKWKGSVALLNQRVCKLIIKNPLELDQDFLFYRIIQEIDRIHRITPETTVKHLSSKDILGIEITLPSQPEQAKIAEILSTVDRAIEQTDALIAKQQRIKTGLMQDLLTRGIDEHGNIRSEETHHFKDSPLGRIPVEWDLSPAHALCLSVIDCKNRTPPATEEGHPLIRTSNVRAGRFILEDLLFTDSVSYDIWTTRGTPTSGDVVITREAPFGEACIIPPEVVQPCLGQRIVMFRPDSTRLLNDYLLYAIYSDRLQKKMLELAGGSTVGHLKVGDIRNLPIPHPVNVDEQRKITLTLNSATESLDQNLSKLAKLSRLKTALMQDLLTGEKPITSLLDESEVITA